MLDENGRKRRGRREGCRKGSAEQSGKQKSSARIYDEGFLWSNIPTKNPPNQSLRGDLRRWIPNVFLSLLGVRDLGRVLRNGNAGNDGNDSMLLSVCPPCPRSGTHKLAQLLYNILTLISIGHQSNTVGVSRAFFPLKSRSKRQRQGPPHELLLSVFHDCSGRGHWS